MCLLIYCSIVLLLIAINGYSRAAADEDEKKFLRLKECLRLVGPFIDSIPPVPLDHIYKRSDVPHHVYNQLNYQFNSVYGYIAPLAYIWPKKNFEIQKAINCSAALGIRIVAKGGGHSYTKGSYGDNDTMVVDMSRYKNIKIDEKEMTVEIGAGARHGEIQLALLRKNLLLPLSSCPTLGITGYALGGGFGYFTRLYGLASDNLLEAEIIDPSSEVRWINKDTKITFMFWALRGAGAGNFGIVTKLKFRIFPAPFTILRGFYEFDLNHFPVFFPAWQFFITETENAGVNNFGSSILIKDGKIIMETFYINLKGQEQFEKKDLKDYVDSFLSKESLNKVKRKFEVLTYSEFLLTTAQYYSKTKLTKAAELNMTKHVTDVGWKKVKSFYVDKKVAEDGVGMLMKEINKFAKYGNIAFFQNGGAMNNFSRTETAFAHRNQLYDVQLWIFSPEGGSWDERLRMDAAMNEFWNNVKNPYIFHHKESYQNYQDADDPDEVARYYKENLIKLIIVKRSWDPKDLFYHNHGIPDHFDTDDKYNIGPEEFYTPSDVF